MPKQLPLPHFDGATYEPELDQGRLAVQLSKVKRLMHDGRWRTLAEVAEHVGSPEASVSARLRDLRKPRFGSFDVQRRRKDKGLFEYRVAPKAED